MNSPWITWSGTPRSSFASCAAWRPSTRAPASVFFNVVNERRIKKRSMIFTTNKHPKGGGAVLHDDDLADAIVVTPSCGWRFAETWSCARTSVQGCSFDGQVRASPTPG
jgi:hypothetical protein